MAARPAMAVPPAKGWMKQAPSCTRLAVISHRSLAEQGRDSTLAKLSLASVRLGCRFCRIRSEGGTVRVFLGEFSHHFHTLLFVAPPHVPHVQSIQWATLPVPPFLLRLGGGFRRPTLSRPLLVRLPINSGLFVQVLIMESITLSRGNSVEKNSRIGSTRGLLSSVSSTPRLFPLPVFVSTHP